MSPTNSSCLKWKRRISEKPLLQNRPKAKDSIYDKN
jgi:hypothetical protein